MSNLCIIPARGGSKRIPRKNIKDFLGKPIIAYSIETALQSGLFDEVMVSTDDEEIAKVAKDYGAKVPFDRSKKNSDDFATLSDVVEEVKAEYEERKINFEYICLILPTAPLIEQNTLKEAYKLLKETAKDSIRPIVAFSYPIQRALRMNENHDIEMINPENRRKRSQDFEKAYYDAGQFYFMKYSTGLEGVHNIGYEIKESQSQDIDTLEDWHMAELKYKFNHGLL